MALWYPGPLREIKNSLLKENHRIIGVRMVMIPSGDHQVQPRKEHSKNKNLDDFFIQPPKPAALFGRCPEPHPPIEMKSDFDPLGLCITSSCC